MPDLADGRLRWPYEDPRVIALAELDGWFCCYCGMPLVSCVAETKESGEARSAIHGFDWPQVDHVIPRSRGGCDELFNLALACTKCNQRKGARTPDEWKAATT